MKSGPGRSTLGFWVVGVSSSFSATIVSAGEGHVSPGVVVDVVHVKLYVVVDVQNV